jgi:hypothetical protein
MTGIPKNYRVHMLIAKNSYQSEHSLQISGDGLRNQMINQKQGNVVMCSLFWKIEGAWINSKQTQCSSSFGIREVQMQKKLHHSGFGNTVRNLKVQNKTLLKICSG